MAHERSGIEKATLFRCKSVRGRRSMQPDFDKLSFDNTVQLFKEWGFLVEQGPGHGEVTLVQPEQRSYCVCETIQLPRVASAILRVRWRSVAMMSPVLDVQ